MPTIDLELKKSCFVLLICGAFLGYAQAQTQDDTALLELYQGLRVADVCDGLDMVGLRDMGVMGTEIEPLWKDTDDMAHIICGVAITARYVPTNRVIQNPMDKEDFYKWEGHWYSSYSDEPFVELIKPGAILVLDVQGDGDTGSVGSYNSLDWYSRGARGIVSNGGIRDTDEIIKQRIPVYLDHAHRGRGIRPGRNEIESVNKPITLGGVLVNPGDILVADGDGVVVVPREHAATVAQYAREILNKDKAGRKSLYDKLGRPHDKTVEIDK